MERLKEKETIKDQVIVANMEADEKMLQQVGDQKY